MNLITKMQQCARCTSAPFISVDRRLRVFEEFKKWEIAPGYIGKIIHSPAGIYYNYDKGFKEQVRDEIPERVVILKSLSDADYAGVAPEIFRVFRGFEKCEE